VLVIGQIGSRGCSSAASGKYWSFMNGSDNLPCSKMFLTFGNMVSDSADSYGTRVPWAVSFTSGMTLDRESSTISFHFSVKLLMKSKTPPLIATLIFPVPLNRCSQETVESAKDFDNGTASFIDSITILNSPQFPQFMGLGNKGRLSGSIPYYVISPFLVSLRALAYRIASNCFLILRTGNFWSTAPRKTYGITQSVFHYIEYFFQ
jgi:hypothetical protein